MQPKRIQIHVAFDLLNEGRIPILGRRGVYMPTSVEQRTAHNAERCDLKTSKNVSAPEMLGCSCFVHSDVPQPAVSGDAVSQRQPPVQGLQHGRGAQTQQQHPRHLQVSEYARESASTPSDPSTYPHPQG